MPLCDFTADRIFFHRKKISAENRHRKETAGKPAVSFSFDLYDLAPFMNEAADEMISLFAEKR